MRVKQGYPDDASGEWQSVRITTGANRHLHRAGFMMVDLLLQNARKRDGHETTIRSVVDFAREVRIHLRDTQVIFGSVTETADRGNASFRIRPWGHTEAMVISFDDVVLASTVKQMGWERHRAIAVAQQSGNFTNVRKIDGK